MKTLLKIILFLVIVLGTVFLLLNEKDISIEEAKKVLTDEQSQFVEVDGMDVHYKIEGTGFPIVLVHGTGAILQTWDAWTEVMVEVGFQVIRMDLMAFGLTGVPKKEDYSTMAFVDFLDKFLEVIEIDSFHLIGNSLGGHIAWQYALDHPEKVAKLVLIAPSGMFKEGGNSSLVFKMAESKTLSKWLLNIGTKMMVKNTLKECYFDDQKITKAKINQYHTASLRSGNRQAFLNRVLAVKEERTDEINQIKNHTLLLWGDKDLLVPVEFAPIFHERLPNSKLMIYENMGHVPQEEIPEKSVSDALRFLAK